MAEGEVRPRSGPPIRLWTLLGGFRASTVPPSACAPKIQRKPVPAIERQRGGPDDRRHHDGAVLVALVVRDRLLRVQDGCDGAYHQPDASLEEPKVTQVTPS